MSNRNAQSGVQSAVRTRPQRPNITQKPAGASGAAQAAARPAGRSRALLAGSPIEAHRVIAATVLVLLLVLTLAVPGPGAPSVRGTAALVTPNIDGSGSVAAAASGADVVRSLFRYRGVVERMQGGADSIPDNLAVLMRLDPNDPLVRKTIVGQIIASSSGNLNMSLVDTGFFSNINDEEELKGVEDTYRSFLDAGQRRPLGVNGLAAMMLLRSLDATGEERAGLEQNAISVVLGAVEEQPDTWQFTYNWALANLLAGNYATAYDGMRGISPRADADDNKLTSFWMGLAALRMGDPGEAIIQFTNAINAEIPSGGNEAYQNLYTQVKKLAREGLADAQWANRDPATAYDTYYETLLLDDNDDTGLYDKWLRLGLQQHAYERLLEDMGTLISSSTAIARGGRVHHDRARLLSFLGRTSEADAEYREAIRLGENDPSLNISYGQALESRGDHNGALARAQDAIRALGKDPASSDLSDVARAAVLTTTAPADLYADQQLLDANILRARAWSGLGQADNVRNLVNGIAFNASTLPPDAAGLLHLYAGFAAEAGGLNDEAVNAYKAAWDALKGMPSGTAGRAAALAGLARATAQAQDAAAGLEVLKSNGYDPAALKAEAVKDLDIPEIMAQAGLLFQQAGQTKEAANALRIAALSGNTQNALSLSGVGRPLWYANGTSVPANAALAAADASRAAGDEGGLAAARYREAIALDPALAPAWNNLGVMLAQEGRPELADFNLSAAGTASPDYALGGHNLAALEYKRGIANFFDAEAAQGAAIKAAGPQSLFWGYNLRFDERGPLPAPSGPTGDWLARLPALIILGLLLLHTLVGNDLLTNRMGLLPTKGVLGMLAGRIDTWFKRVAPGIVQPRSDARGLLLTVGIPSLIGMLALAWASGHGSVEVALVYLPVALLAALLAFGANELAQYLMARGNRGVTLHHPWPLGVLLGVLSIPFNFVYGWQAITRVQPATPEVEGTAGKRARTGDDLDLAYEAQVEAAAEMDPSQAAASAVTAVAPAPAAKWAFGLSPAARILFAGLAANLVIGLIFAIAYWITGWPSLRLGMYASMLVLAFTAVSEPPADGWTIYRRNAPLWLALFVFAATAVTLLAAGII